MSGKKKVLIIGMDGFTWNVGRGLIDQGHMPNLAELIRRGCHGDLKSVIPYETSPAWVSFQTGCNPDKTSIFGFHRYDASAGKISLNSFANASVPSLWQLADRNGKTVVSLNMPMSFPPPKVKGIIVPGLMCPRMSSKTVHPSNVYRKYIKPVENYNIVNTDRVDTLHDFVNAQIKTEKARYQSAKKIMNDIDWDIFSFQMQSTDYLQHELWWTLDRDARGYSEEAYNEAIRLYIACDEIIGELVNANPNALTIVVSDHGFCRLKGLFQMNTWLEKNGYLKTIDSQSVPKTPFAAFKHQVKKRVPIVKSLARLYGNILKTRKQSTEKDLPYCNAQLGYLQNLIDIENTKAFSLGALASMIHITPEGNRQKDLAARITEGLLKDFGPASDQPVISRISSGKELYGTEENVDALPDLVVEFEKGYCNALYPLSDEMVGTPYYSNEFSENVQRGTHERNGIMVIAGEGVKAGPLDAEIIDIAPTVLACMGLPVPKHIDGKVLTEAFDTPPQVTYEDIDIDTKGKAKYSEAEQAEIEKQLADLGYI
ncbi:MAG TPA: hypothetical protein ENH94_05745 [Phycisphaerales bacterium]|nr:hypothetical protein [Phycisphaerales bacterium]